MRLLPGWLAQLPGTLWRFDGDESIRRRPVDRIAEPLELMGARIDATRRPLPALHRGTAPALESIEYELPVASAQVKSCAAVRRPGHARRPDGDRARAHARPHRADPRRRRRARSAATATPCTSPTSTSSGSTSSRSPPTRPRPPSTSPPRCSSPARSIRAAQRRDELDPDGLPAHRRARWARRSTATSSPPATGGLARAGLRPRGRASPSSPAPRSTPTRSPSPSTSSRSSRCSAASPRGRRSSAAPRSCASRRPTGSPPSSRSLGALGAQIEATPDGFVVEGTGALHGGRLHSRGDHRMAMLGAVAGLASRVGRRGRGGRGDARLLPGLRRATWDALTELMVVAIDGPAGAGKSSVAKAVAAHARLHLPRHRGDVPRVGLAAREQDRPPADVAREIAIERRRPGDDRRARRDRGDPHPAGRGGRLEGRRRPRGPGRARRPPAGARGRGRLGGRGPRHLHRRRARRRGQDLPDGLARGARAAPRRASSASTPRRCSPSCAAATSATPATGARRSTRRRARSCSRPRAWASTRSCRRSPRSPRACEAPRKRPHGGAGRRAARRPRRPVAARALAARPAPARLARGRPRLRGGRLGRPLPLDRPRGGLDRPRRPRLGRGGRAGARPTRPPQVRRRDAPARRRLGRPRLLQAGARARAPAGAAADRRRPRPRARRGLRRLGVPARALPLALDLQLDALRPGHDGRRGRPAPRRGPPVDRRARR